MNVSDYQAFFDKPVAVQLKSPCLVIDNDGEPKNRVEHEGKTYGVPYAIIRPTNSATAGTTALPRARSRSIRWGTPSSAPTSSGEACPQCPRSPATCDSSDV